LFIQFSSGAWEGVFVRTRHSRFKFGHSYAYPQELELTMGFLEFRIGMR